MVQKKLEELSNIGEQTRLLQRLLIGHATDMELDAQGRLRLPQMLRSFAGLEKKLVLVGQGNKIEIWSEGTWRDRMTEWLARGAEELSNGSGDGELTGLSV